jgi:hypothetical protein
VLWTIQGAVYIEIFIIRCVIQTYEQLNHDNIGIFTKKKNDKLAGSF